MIILCSLILGNLTQGCGTKEEINANPWLVEYTSRHGSTVSRSQMRAMVRLGNFYREQGLESEYVHCLTTAVELYAGDMDVTFDLLNILIESINEKRTEVLGMESVLERYNIDTDTISVDNLLHIDAGRDVAENYLEARSDLESQYEECYRILVISCTQIPYNAELYFNTAHLQYLRASDDGDRDKFKIAIEYLKRAIASDSAHLESYHLIALTYEKLNDMDRALRFWRLFEVIYEMAPETLGQGFLTPYREGLHAEALEHIAEIEHLEGGG